jgi:hypothetical protein
MTDRPFVCPFCPLHCDDLNTAELANRCGLFAGRMSAAEKDVADAKDLDRLLATATQWVGQADTMVVTGTIVDLNTARAVCEFVERTGASLLVGNGYNDGFSQSFARDGMFSITLGDAAAPHQSVVMIGDCGGRLPRLRERLGGVGTIYSWRSTDNLLERLSRLRLAINRSDASSVDDDSDLAETLALCQHESAVTFVVAVEHCLDGQQRPFWSTFSGLIRELNRRIRASLLRFDDAMTLRSVATWTSDGPPLGGMAMKQLADLEILFSPWPIPAETTAVFKQRARRRITIGFVDHASHHIQMGGDEHGSLLHLPAAMPGISHAGIVIRGDGSVTLPLGQVHPTTLPPPSTTLLRLLPDKC